MKKYFLLLSVIVLGLSACKKTDVVAEQADVDDRKIQAYLAANYKTTTFTKDPSGLYYSVVKLGTGAYPKSTSSVQVAYTFKLLNGSTVESTGNTTATYDLSADVIAGWKIGIPHINAGTVSAPNTAGRIILIIPSALGYGAVAQSKFPANSVLVYTIDLIGIAN